MGLANSIITPDWPAPENVRAWITTREHGVSGGPFESLNLGDHVGDNAEDVVSNRRLLEACVGCDVQWLQQTHTTDIHIADTERLKTQVEADAVITRSKSLACGVLTADCLPLLICDRDGTFVGAVHAGWRGLANGIITNAVQASGLPASELMAYLGPAISQKHFEVGEDVLRVFKQPDKARRFAEPVEQAFTPNAGEQGKYFADLFRLARAELHQLGVHDIYGGGFCTYADDRRFFSFRRDGVTGRLASVIRLI